jgi:hypothetical protein
MTVTIEERTGNQSQSAILNGLRLLDQHCMNGEIEHDLIHHYLQEIKTDILWAQPAYSPTMSLADCFHALWLFHLGARLCSSAISLADCFHAP